MMTVKELIQHLEEIENKDLCVYIFNHDDQYWYDLAKPKVNSLYHRARNYWDIHRGKKVDDEEVLGVYLSEEEPKW